MQKIFTLSSVSLCALNRATASDYYYNDYVAYQYDDLYQYENEMEFGYAYGITDDYIPDDARDQIAKLAETWLYSPVPYSEQAYWYDGYRTDCSGYVSMAWQLGTSETTWTLPQYSHQISQWELQRGDILLNIDEHVLIFDSWTDSSQTYYWAYEQSPPAAAYRIVEYPYWSGSSGVYLPYRLNRLGSPAEVNGTHADVKEEGEKHGAFRKN